MECLIDASPMRAQLHALLDAGRRPNVTVQVLPLEVGTHAGLDGPFILLGFPEEIAPDVAYVGTRIGDAHAGSAGTVRFSSSDRWRLLRHVSSRRQRS
jgi:Domain of unknown function (DUF5753)